MKNFKIITTVLQVIGLLVIVITAFVPSPAFISPAAFGAILLLLGLRGIVTNEVATRVNLISREKNKIYFYLIVLTYFIGSALLFWHSHSLLIKP